MKFDIANAFIQEDSSAKIRFNIKKINRTAFEEDINIVDWSDIFTFENDLNQSFDYFIGLVTELIEKHAPQIPPIKTKRAPWSTRYVGKLSKTKRNKWDRYKYTKTRYDYEQYRTALYRFNTGKEEAIRRYEMNIIANKRSRPKSYYDYVGSKNKYCDTKMSIKSNDGIITDDKECADEFNNFFSSIFTQGQANMAEYESDTFRQFPSMDDVEITEHMVRTEILKLDHNKASGPDEVPARLLIDAVDVFTPILTKIIQISYEKSVVPENLKSGNVVPIHKSGDKTDVRNYRPVSLTSIIAKLFERVIKRGVESHIDRYKIMDERQHGFRRNKSTSTNMIMFWNEITNMVESTSSISILYTDLRKAFDSVPHDLLCEIEAIWYRWKNWCMD